MAAADKKILRILESLNKLDMNVEARRVRQDSIESTTTASEETQRSVSDQLDPQLSSDWVQEDGSCWRITVRSMYDSPNLILGVYEDGADTETYQLVIAPPAKKPAYACAAKSLDSHLKWRDSEAFIPTADSTAHQFTSDQDKSYSSLTEGEEVNKNNHTVNTAKILRKSSTRRPSCSQISESLYSTLNKHSARNIMPTSTMETHTIPSAEGNEYGITNVSSQGRVSITVVPPRQQASRSRSQTPFDHDFKSRVPPATTSDFAGNEVESSGYRAVRSATDSSYRLSPSSNVSGSSYASSATGSNPAPPRKPPRAASVQQEDNYASRLKELYYRRQLEDSGHEQNELDEILRELLGDAHNAGVTSTSSSSHRQHSISKTTGSSTAGNQQTYRAQSSSNATENGVSGSSWLEQQQHKLSQRQQARDQGDIAQVHRQQKQLVSELKNVQTRRQTSFDDNANSLYRTEHDIQVSSSAHEPEAYTVFIKPDEFKKQPPVDEKNNISKKSITNVSHTHHTHYNFHDNGDEDQKRRIMQLEDELRKVKMGMDTPPPPVRPQKLDLDDDGEDEEYLFKPVGIASLESGTGASKTQQHTQFNSSLSSAGSSSPGFRTTSNSSPASTTGPKTNTNHRNGQSTIQSHTMKSQSTYSGNVSSPQPSLEQLSPPLYKLVPVTPITPVSPGHNAVSPGIPMSPLTPVLPKTPTSPQTPYQLMSPSVLAVGADYTQSSTGGHQQRMIIEEQRMQQQQQMYQQQNSAGGMLPSHTGTLQSHTGTLQTHNTLPSQTSTINQVTRQHQQHTTSYGYNQHNSAASANFVTSPTASAPGGAILPLDQTLHVNTAAAGGTQANHSGGVTYATIAGSPAQSGHVQFMSESSEGHSTNDHQNQLNAKFVKDTSKYWYKPHISRDDVIQLLKNATPGTFIVRDSNSFPGAFGLAVKVAQLPPNVQIKTNSDPATEYVRFYLIEPTTKGVKLKGCSNEPVFASLASLIYQHTITPLALPCKLLLPDPDQYQFGNRVFTSAADEVDGPPLDSPGRINGSETMSTAGDLLKRGAACNVVYMNNVDTESLTGPQAISRAVHHTFGKDVLETTVATFKVSADGITITDNNRKIFFRQHFPKESISYCGIDPADRRFSQSMGVTDVNEAKIFGFVAKKKGGNQCLLFSELDPEQPASAIVNFVSKVLLGK